MRAGIQTMLERVPGIRVLAAVGDDPAEVAHALYSTTPDVVIVEDAPGRADGVELARRLAPEDHAILAMRVAATSRREIADTLRIDACALRGRMAAMIARLRDGAAATWREPAPAGF